MRTFALHAGLAAGLAAPAGAQIYADFDTTLGPFTIVMDRYLTAPQAVSNFIRLAEGSVPWLDPVSGELKFDTPFYDGLRFHRIVANSEIATGAPTGTAYEDPGWTFADDPRTFLSGPFNVYMDNRDQGGGNPRLNGNGSRIFIRFATLPAAEQGLYSRIGYVGDGTQTYPPGNNGRLTVANISLEDVHPVTIRSVTIRRSPFDPTALAFDEDRWYLPEMAPARAFIRRENGTYLLDSMDDGGSISRFKGSLDLRSWFGSIEAVHYPGQLSPGYDLSTDMGFAPRLFYRGVTAHYPRWRSSERPLPGAVIVVNFQKVRGQPATQVKIRYGFNEAGTGGGWVYETAGGLPYGGGSFTVDEFRPDGPFNATLRLSGSGDHPPFRYTLHFDAIYDDDPSLVPISNPSRLTVQEIDASGPFPVVAGTYLGGSWIYTPRP